MFPARVYTSYLSLAGEDRWACRSIFEVLPSGPPERITLEHLPSDVIETPLEQLACLALITKALRPKQIFEIGTFRGRTALNFALNSPEDCKVYTMDLPPEERCEAIEAANRADSTIISRSTTGSEYRGKDVAFKIEQIYADSLLFDFTGFDGKVDLVYVDGAHHYAAARSDTQNALRIVRQGGYVIWDEFGIYGAYNDVTRAVLDCVPLSEISQIENTQLAVYRRPE